MVRDIFVITKSLIVTKLVNGYCSVRSRVITQEEPHPFPETEVLLD
jgi:hypothetical protein